MSAPNFFIKLLQRYSKDIFGIQCDGSCAIKCNASAESNLCGTDAVPFYFTGPYSVVLPLKDKETLGVKNDVKLFDKNNPKLYYELNAEGNWGFIEVHVVTDIQGRLIYLPVKNDKTGLDPHLYEFPRGGYLTCQETKGCSLKAPTQEGFPWVLDGAYTITSSNLLLKP